MSWKEIRSSIVRDQKLMNFAIEEAKDVGADPEMVYHILKFGFLSRRLTSDDVHYEDGEIVSIDGAAYNLYILEGGPIIDKPERVIPKKTIPTYKNQKNPLEKSVNNYLEERKTFYKDG